MKRLWCTRFARRALYIALPLALCLTFLLPAIAEAHAILLRSDPTRDAVLNSPPSQVRMWFSEDLNPTFSTAIVINSANQRVDLKDAHVSSSDPREMDVSLQPTLPAAAYIVVWRTQSADDGHILSGSFIFSVALPDGTVPKFSGVPSGVSALGGGTSSGASTGQLDAPTLFSFIMVTLVDLGVVFWVGAQLWRTFVQPVEEDENQDEELKAIQRREEQRFDRVFSLPALFVILLANIGVLIGQSLSITGGNLGQALSPTILAGLVSSGRFGTYWSMRQIVVVLAILVALYTLFFRQRSRLIAGLIPWANLVLGLALLIAVTLSGHAAATTSNVVVYAILVDWLHLLAASLWVGGMMYIAVIYLPALKGSSPIERTRSLLATLPRFSPLAITGVIIMAVSGPFNATMHLLSLNQLLTTAYGRALDVKVLLVAALLVTSATHVRLFRPGLNNDYKKYVASRSAAQTTEQAESGTLPERAEQVKQLEHSVSRQTARLARTLRWEPLLGVGVLICTGLMNVFAGTLLPPATTPPPSQGTAPQVKPFTATAQTSDKKFTVELTVSPNRFGPNIFTVKVLDNKGKPDTNVGVSVYTTMLDMDMGTDSVNLQPNGKGGFSAEGDLSMPGRWGLRIQIRTLDNTLHETKITMTTPD